MCERTVRSPALSRRGLTFIELLVVIAILGVLIGLILPAVQKFREAANRLQCANNLKQFSLACTQYHMERGAYPPGGMCLPNDQRSNLDWSSDKGTWLVYTLPYMDQEQVFQRIPNLKVPYFNSIGAAEKAGILPHHFAALRCPSDSFEPAGPYSNYAGSLGPQCLDDKCGVNPFASYCNKPAWGYKTSTDDASTQTLAQCAARSPEAGRKSACPM